MSLAHRTGGLSRRDPAPVPRRARAWLAAVLLALVAVSGAGTARAALLWTITVSPTIVTTGSVTNFSLAASTDPLGPIKCITVDVPSNFNVLSVTAGSGWSSVGVGNQVRVTSSGGIGGVLRPVSMSFTVRAQALSPGQIDWQAHAYPLQGCTGAGPLVGVDPVVLVLPAPTPAPVPTLPPTPAPTVAPTPTPRVPLPTPSATVPLPTIPGLTPTPSATPRGSSEQTPSPGATDDGATPRASGTPRPGSGSGPVGSGASSQPESSGDPSSVPGSGRPGTGSGSVGASAQLTLTSGPVAGGLSFDLAGGMIDTGSFVWLVPAATFAAPGLLILLWIALQAGGALAWAPAIRRLRRGGLIPGRAAAPQSAATPS